MINLFVLLSLNSRLSVFYSANLFDFYHQSTFLEMQDVLFGQEVENIKTRLLLYFFDDFFQNFKIHPFFPTQENDHELSKKLRLIDDGYSWEFLHKHVIIGFDQGSKDLIEILKSMVKYLIQKDLILLKTIFLLIFLVSQFSKL